VTRPQPTPSNPQFSRRGARRRGPCEGGGLSGKGTPATKALERAKLAVKTHTYVHDPKHESYGLEAAEALGLDPATVFKTLVAEVDGRLTVAVVPVERQLELKALASAAGGKRAQLAQVQAAERATGYVAGGISPLGQRKQLPTVIDESALEHAAIYVSGGRRALEIELAPRDLIRLTNATVAAISGSPRR
jgi:Cys-tRNA(Pro)/Cys-tRNA(Cys) deacylase